jgi:methylmalonyl-CoA mutase
MLPTTLPSANAFPQASLQDWRRLVDQDLAGAPFERKLITHTYEGLDIKPLYTRADWPPDGDPSGFSGQPPFTRGSIAGGAAVAGPNANTGWDIRQEITDPCSATANGHLLADLMHGATSVLLRVDAAGRAGLDADDPRAGGPSTVGRDGISLSAPGNWEEVLSGVHLGALSVWLEPGSAFIPAAAQLAAHWQRTGLPESQARGGFGADPLAVLARDGHLPHSLDEGLRQLADLAIWTAGRYARDGHSTVRAVRVGTAAYHHAGATATQDLAFSMATAVEYLRAMSAAGLPIAAAAGQITFSYATGCHVFLAIAKLRAARRLWARVAEACSVPASHAAMDMHVRPSKRVLTTRDPWVNILRNTACVFAAGVAGASAVGSVPFDAPLGDSSELGRRLARNTPLILTEESHLHRVCDPAGGSWYIEWLTDSLADMAWALFQKIEARGGMARSLQDGWVAGQIDSAVQPRLKNIALRKDAVLGVSEFPNLQEHLPVPPVVDRTSLARQAAQAVATHRATSAAGAIAKALAPRSDERFGTLSDRAFQAALAGATLGQIAAALDRRSLPASVTPVAVHPYAEPFERLREAADRYAQQCGTRPRVFLASMGTPAQHLARTNFAKNLLQAGGFLTESQDGFASVQAAAAALAADGAAIAVICASDVQYPELVPQLAPALHAAGARTVLLAGNPGDKEGLYRQAGIDRFIFVKCDVVAVLSSLLTEQGALS